MPRVLLFVLFVFFCGVAHSEGATVRPPNILLIVVDDVGYTDLGSFGGEIETPNLDALAYKGTRLTNFYTASTCSPTRAMLLTGTDHHLVGLGNMHEELSPNQKGQVGYEGHLNTRAASLAEVLKNAGYNTYMAGKWHLGLDESNSPAARGFDRSYVLLNGGGGHFDDLGLFGGTAKYRENGQLVSLPENFYSTQFYTEKMMAYIGSGEDKPFFAYLAYTAVHWPLQAPASSIAKYRGRYSEGYDQLHQQRINGAIAKGVVPADSRVGSRLEGELAWSEVNADQRKREARTMEIYAAMLDDVDVYVGRLIEHLKAIGQFDNTVIFFMSDNGAEGHDIAQGLTELGPWVESCCNNHYENMGAADSYLLAGPNWARASVGPGRLYKGMSTEGGIKAPAFIHYPQKPFKQSLHKRFSTVQDVMPTLLDLAGVETPTSPFLGRDILPPGGRSLLNKQAVHSVPVEAGWELMGKRAYRRGDWKIVHLPVPYGNGSWQLYNLREDPGEQQDLSNIRPEELKVMLDGWERYASTNNVILPDWVSGY